MASGCFDLLAADYDRTWTNSGAGRLQRNAVWRQMIPLFRPGEIVLDLGCGTGEDAERLELFGVSVRALDASPEMVRIARARGVNAEVAKIEEIRKWSMQFDGVISNFGALNCVRGSSRLCALRWRRLVRPGGYLVLCLMGRFCLMRVAALSLPSASGGKRSRRWRGQTYAERLGISVFYPSARGGEAGHGAGIPSCCAGSASDSRSRRPI